MKRGEIWWTDLPQPIGTRPVLVLTRDSVVNSIGSIVIALITRTVRDLPSEVILWKQEELPSRSVASMDNLMTVPRSRLTRLMGACAAPKLNQIDSAIRYALDLK